jgi:hypothetical protein
MTAVPPEKVGMRVEVELKDGAKGLQDREVAIGVELITVNVAILLVAEPTEFDTITLYCEVPTLVATGVV